MSRWIRFVGFVAVLVVPVGAQQLVHRDLIAAAMTKFEIEVLTGQTVVIGTQDLSDGCDTVLHLLDGPIEVAGNDDAPGDDSGASLITFTNTNFFKTAFVVLMRARSREDWGTADLFVNGISVLDDAAVRGTLVPVTGGAPFPWIYETVLAPLGGFGVIGSANPEIYALGEDGRIFAYDDNGGVGLNARIEATGTTQILVAAVTDFSFSGGIHLYANDALTGMPFSDTDFDGLGNQLEAVLGTCSGGPSEAACTNVYNAQDTDHDGISDFHEVFGIDDPVAPQHLPKWGANPLHKDVFVEVDYIGGIPLSANEMRTIREVFARAPADDINNPDGEDGISVHIDVRLSDLSLRALLEDPELATLYGDWGGSNEATKPYETAPETYRHPVRAGIFHYALAREDGAQAAQYGDRFEFNGTQGNFCHELGHNLGLSHAGHGRHGSLNAKPNYFSLMNYAYESKVGVGFSDGLHTGSLNPSDVDEASGLGLPVPAPFNEKFRRQVVGGSGIDWDWNGEIDDSIRTALNFLVRGSGGEALSKNSQTLAWSQDIRTSPVLVRAFGHRLYAFFVDRQDRVQFTSAPLSGPDAHGSCPGGGQLGQVCTEWSPAQPVPTREAAAAVGAAFYGGRLVISYRTPDSRVRVLSAGSFLTGSGGLSEWSSDELVNISSMAEPHLAAIYVGPDHFGGAESVLGLFVVATDATYRWLTTPDALQPFELQESRFPDAALGGAPLAGPYGPTVITWPHFDPGHQGPRSTIGVATNARGELRLLVYDPAANGWDDRSAQTFRSPVTSDSKPGLAFHALRSRSGEPVRWVEDGIPEGQLWLATTRSLAARMWVSTLVRGGANGISAEFNDDREGWFHNMWSKNDAGTGTALYEDLSISALKALRVQTHKYEPEQLFFYPFADGTFSTRVMEDVNDWRVMERGIGVGIAGEGFCGAAGQTRWIY